MKISLKSALLVAFIPFAQLFARISSLNGSLDKKWLLLPPFMIPPFSFIPAGMMYFGKVKEGSGGKPYDKFMLIPILTSFIFKILQESGIVSMGDLFNYFVFVLLPILISSIVFYIRSKNICGGSGSFLNSIQSSISMHGTSKLMETILGFVPVLGTVLNILSSMGPLGIIVNSIIETVTMSISYILINMFTGDNLVQYCTGKINGGLFSYSTLMFIFLTVYHFLGNYFSQLPLLGLLFKKKISSIKQFAKPQFLKQQLVSQGQYYKNQFTNPQFYKQQLANQAQQFIQTQQPIQYTQPMQQPIQYTQPIQQPIQYTQPIQQPIQYTQPIQQPIQYTQPMQQPIQ